VCHPVIVRTVNANMQDPLLLFTDLEIKSAKKKPCDVCNKSEENNQCTFRNIDILDRSNDELKLRWVNFILSKAFKTMKEREIKAAH
jgi:hypothetical protein